MTQLSYLALGLVAGVVSGFFGVGGGTILIPGMVFLFGFAQHQAQGTTLAVMLPPVFFFAAWRYYNEGHVNVPLAVWAAVGLTVGALIGAHCVQALPDAVLKRAFGIFLVLVGMKMAFLR